jgi:uncharacterized membrane protein
MELYLALLRWVHIGAGIIWIGLLYYFNLVQVPSFAQMEAPARSNAIMILVPRALFWFRYAALTTALVGILYILSIGFQTPGYWESPQFKSILIGGTFGLIMAFNVWYFIWPNQKKIIAATTDTVQNGTPAPPDQPKWARTATLASRTNVMLSSPMLFFMVAAGHLPSLWL